MRKNATRATSLKDVVAHSLTRHYLASGEIHLHLHYKYKHHIFEVATAAAQHILLPHSDGCWHLLRNVNFVAFTDLFALVWRGKAPLQFRSS